MRAFIITVAVGLSILSLSACASAPLTAAAPTGAAGTPYPTLTAPASADAQPIETLTADPGAISPTTTSTSEPSATAMPSATATSVPSATSVPPIPTTAPRVPTALPARLTATSTPVPPDGSLTLTLADAGRTIDLKVGQSFLLALGEGMDWTVTIADPSIVSRQVNILVVRGAQGVYVAHRPGQTTLLAAGNPQCRNVSPPCAIASRLVQMTLVVH